MVDRQKIVAAVKTGSRRGLRAGALLVGMSVLASCSMFDDEPSVAADDPAVAARAIGQVQSGLVGDGDNARYDESIRRRPVTTVRPLEESQVPAVVEPEPAPQAAAAPVEAAPVAAAPEEAPAAPVAPAAAEPAAAPEPQPVVTARPSGTSPVIAESKPAPLVETVEMVERGDLDAPAGAVQASEPVTAAVEPAPVPVAPAPQPQLLVADTSRLDAAVAQAYGGRAAPRVAPLNPAAMTGAVGVAASGGYGAGPVVIGGAMAQPAMQPAVMSHGGTVVVGGGGGIQPAVVVGGGGGTVSLPAGGEPVAVIHFEFGSKALGARDHQVIRQVADLQARQGGFIKVVGHSSRFTADMPQQRHMLVNFETSVARADAVAAALVREGVPGEVVEVAALGASEPRYQEVMPSGQVGNQRVEIFLVR